MNRRIYADDHEAFRATVRTFLERSVIPYVEKYAEEGMLPREFWLEAGEIGSYRALTAEARRLRPQGEALGVRFPAEQIDELDDLITTARQAGDEARVARAQALKAKLLQSGEASLTETSRSEGISRSYLTRLARLAFLAPDIVCAILEGRQPTPLTAARLTRITQLPLDWSEQRKALGFG